LSDDAIYVQFTPCFYLSDKPYVLVVMPSGVLGGNVNSHMVFN